MIPYLTLPNLQIGPLSINPTSLMVAMAILTGHLLLIRRARKSGFDAQLTAGFSFSMLVSGFIFGHLVKLLYSADCWNLVREHPSQLVALFSGQASFGGLGGGLLGGWIYLRLRKVDAAGTLRLFDCLALVFPYAWFFGRMHCVIGHDHPGLRTTSWLGVRYPDAVRFDLGVLEVMFLPVILVLFAVLGRKQRAPGFFLAVFLVVYGAFRMGLDQLHVDVVRYLGVSVDQWASGLAIAGGLLWFSLQARAAESTAPGTAQASQA